MDLIEALVVMLPLVLLVSPDVPVIYAEIATVIAGIMVIGLIVKDFVRVAFEEAREKNQRRARIRRARKKEKERVAASRISRKAA